MSKSQTAGLWSVVRWKQDTYLFMLHCMGTFIEVIPEKCTVVCYLACWLPQRAVVKSSQGASHKGRLAQLAIYGHGPCGASYILMSLCVELTRLQHGGGSYKKEQDILRFRHNEVNLRLHLVITETPQKFMKYVKWDLKIDLIIFEAHDVKLIFLLTSYIVQLFDFWHNDHFHHWGLGGGRGIGQVAVLG